MNVNRQLNSKINLLGFVVITLFAFIPIAETCDPKEDWKSISILGGETILYYISWIYLLVNQYICTLSIKNILSKIIFYFVLIFGFSLSFLLYGISETSWGGQVCGNIESFSFYLFDINIFLIIITQINHLHSKD